MWLEVRLDEPFVTAPVAWGQDHRVDDGAALAPRRQGRFHLNVLAVVRVEEGLAHEREDDVRAVQLSPDRRVPAVAGCERFVHPELEAVSPQPREVAQQGVVVQVLRVSMTVGH